MFLVEEYRGLPEITGFNSVIREDSANTLYNFSLSDKSIEHYFIFVLFIIILCFIILTFLLSFRVKVKRIWLWRIAIFVGICQFSFNWSTSELDFALIRIQLFSTAMFKSGNIAPWHISLSIPFFALVFWILNYKDMLNIQQINSDNV